MCIIVERTTHKLALGAQFSPTTIMQRVPHTGNIEHGVCGTSNDPTPPETYLHKARRKKRGRKDDDGTDSELLRNAHWTGMNTNAVESYYRNTLHWYATSQSASQLVSPSEWDKEMNSVKKYDARNEGPTTAMWTNEKKDDNSEEEKQNRKAKE